jgi:hypothetical protein
MAPGVPGSAGRMISATLLIICASSLVRNRGVQAGSLVGLQDCKVAMEIGKLEMPVAQAVHFKASRLFIDK